MKYMHYAVLVFLFLGISGCGSVARISERVEPDDTLVYGYIKMSNEGMPIQLYLSNFVLKQIDPPTNSPYKSCGRNMGSVIYHDLLKPGSYRVDSFQAFGGFALGPYKSNDTYVRYTVPVQDNGFTITKPGLYYFGTYEVINRWSFGKVEYDIQKVNYPSEEDVIVRVLEFTDKGTYWEKMLNDRLAQLRKWRTNDFKKSAAIKLN